MKKAILQYNKYGNFIEEFDSIKQASLVSGVLACNISRALRNKQIKVNKYIWKYKELNKTIDYKYILAFFSDKIILDRHGKEIKGITSKTRKRDYADLRMVFYKLCYDHAYNFNAETCADFVGRDRTTILHSLGNFEFIYNDKLFIYRDMYKNFNKRLVKMKLRNKSVVETPRQDVYRMTKKNLILQLLESDDKVKKLNETIQTMTVVEIDVEYDVVEG